RISHEFANDSGATRTSFDSGHIDAAGRKELISEVELKLRRGALNAYAEGCLSFLGRTPAALLAESKAARGYRLASGEQPSAVHAGRFTISSNVPLPQAIVCNLRHSFQHFLDNHPAATLRGTPESIHQMRVALRRLRSAIGVFSPVLCLEGANGLVDELKALFSKLGQVREADVFIGETLPTLSRMGLGVVAEKVLLTEVN